MDPTVRMKPKQLIREEKVRYLSSSILESVRYLSDYPFVNVSFAYMFPSIEMGACHEGISYAMFSIEI